MKCATCGEEMDVRRGSYHYTESGLDNVYLDEIEIDFCSKCAEEMAVIPDLPGLHNTIALVLITKPYFLTGKEIRFLRKEMGFKAVNFAKVVKVAPETLSTWENDKEEHSRSVDILIRLYYAGHLSAMKGYNVDRLRPFQDHLAKLELTNQPTGTKLNFHYGEPPREVTEHLIDTSWIAASELGKFDPTPLRN